MCILYYCVPMYNVNIEDVKNKSFFLFIYLFVNNVEYFNKSKIYIFINYNN